MTTPTKNPHTPASDQTRLMVEAAADAVRKLDASHPRTYEALCVAALTSIGLPLADLQWAAENAAVVRALRSGEWVAVPKEPHWMQTEKIINTLGFRRGTPEQAYMAAIAAAPKSPSEEV